MFSHFVLLRRRIPTHDFFEISEDIRELFTFIRFIEGKRENFKIRDNKKVDFTFLPKFNYSQCYGRQTKKTTINQL